MIGGVVQRCQYVVMNDWFTLDVPVAKKIGLATAQSTTITTVGDTYAVSHPFSTDLFHLTILVA